MDYAEDLTERFELRLVLLIARIAIEQILDVLVYNVQVFTQAQVHSAEGLTHFHHLFLNIFRVLLRLFLIALLEDVLAVLGKFVIADFFEVRDLEVGGEFFGGVDFVEEAVDKFVLNMLGLQLLVEVVLALVAVLAALGRADFFAGGDVFLVLAVFFFH